ncbi:MAG: histidine phosphatase family protein [Pseudomonadota bacterium]
MSAGPLLYYVRHGQTDWNAELRFQGSRDIPLNDTGRLQAEDYGQKLSSLIDDGQEFQFISSPLCRARETMEIIRKHLNMPIGEYSIDDRLREISYGNFEGRTQPEIKAENRTIYYERKQNMWTFRPEGGESHQDVIGRVRQWYESLDPSAKYLVTAHGAIGRVLRHVILGLSPDEVSKFRFPQDRVFRFKEGLEEQI